jgi:pimeloyl-ACP methyl ester carboxylesterase
MAKKLVLSAGKSLLFVLAVLSSLLSLAGVGVYGVYLWLRGPIWLRNQFMGLWLAVTLFIYSLQTMYTLLKRPRFVTSCLFFVDFVQFLLAFGGSVLIAVCNGLLMRLDSICWSAAVAVVCLVNCFLLVSRRAKTKRANDRQSYLATTATDFGGARRAADGCCIWLTRLVNIALKLLGLVLIGLLANGAVVNGIGTLRYVDDSLLFQSNLIFYLNLLDSIGCNLRYPARGSYVRVDLGDGTGRTIRLHYFCHGPKNSSLPVIVFEGSGSHAHADYLSLQALLSVRGRRSCVWDRAGLGYSDFMYADMRNDSSYYHNFLTAMLIGGGERAPFVLVGWGGGAMFIYEYASKHPQMVHSLVYLDASPPGIEWNSTAFARNLSASALEHFKRVDLVQRYITVFLINGLGVPFGLMPLFVPPIGTYLKELSAEVTWYFHTEKTWTKQRYYLDELLQETNLFETLAIRSNISVTQIMSRKSDEQIAKLVCSKQLGIPINSSKCQQEIRANEYAINEKTRLVRNGGKVIDCNMDECDLGYFVHHGAAFTVDNLLNI